MRHMPMWSADVTGCCIICSIGINRVLFVLAGMKIRIVFFHLSIQLYHFRRNDIIECIKFNTICKSNLFHRINIRYWLKIIPNNRTVFHTPCSIFFISHIGKIRLHNSGDSVMGNQNVSFFFRFFPDIIEKIIDSLCQTKCRFSSLMAAGKEFFRLFKVLSIPRRRFLSSQKSTVTYLLPG